MIEALKSFILWIKSLFEARATGLPTPQEWVRLRKKTMEIAQAMGKIELPSESSIDLSEPERNIETFALQEKNYHTKIFDIAKKEIANKLGSFAPSLLVSDLKIEAGRAVTAFEASMNDHTAEVFIKKREYDGRKSEYEHFKAKNRLKGESNHPKSILLHVGILLSILLVEMLSNAYFFMDASPLGFVGGFIQALMIASIGIFLAWATSCFIRQANHISIIRKVFFAIFVLLSSSCLVIFVLSIGHLRDFQDLNPTIGIRGLDPQFFANELIYKTLIFSSIDSYVMTAVILVFSIFAVIDFFKMDDAYPGYGRITRKFEESFDELNECQKTQRELLYKNREEAEHALRNLQKIVETKIGQQANLIAIYNIKEQQYIKDIENIKTKANELLVEFRKINLSERKTPAPAYFNNNYIEWEKVSIDGVQPVLSGDTFIELQQTFAQTIQASYSQVQSYFLQSQAKLNEAVGKNE
jgi:hypothetical protein